MFAVAGGPSFAGSPLPWSLLFARQPEPDLEFTEEELEQTTNVRSSSPIKPPRKSGGRPFLWLLLLVLVAGGAYLAMEPEMITDLVGPLLGESSSSSTSARPAPSMPRPSIPSTQPDASSQSAGTPSVPTPQAGGPTPVAPTVPSPSASMPTAPANPGVPPAMAPPTSVSASPIFGEGQKVTATFNSTALGDGITLTQDPAGMKPGPAISPGTTLTILDGDLQPSGWVYSVRSDEGVKGWIPERRLRLKP